MSAAAAASSKSASCQDDDSLPEPDYDHLDLSFASMMEDEEDDLKKGTKKGAAASQSYIVGTLIVRVVAARDLPPVQNTGLGNLYSYRSKGSSNPYASVKFAGQTQRTTEVFDTVDPIWPRGETMFMDVSLPLSQVTHRNESDTTVAAAAAVPAPTPDPLSKPILTVALFHAVSSNTEKYPTKKTQVSGDSDEPFLGMASIDVTPLLTGKITTLDKWLPLTGTPSKDKSRATARIVVEYEASDPPPRPGDVVRFCRFVDASDLYPVPPCDSYRVDEVVGDNIILQYPTPEGWLCTFQAHRFMLICVERHQGAVEVYQEELANLAERLGKSPLVNVVAETVERVPEEGLMTIGVDAVRGGASLLDRWLKGGVEIAAQDIVYATNFDGRFNSNSVESEASISTSVSNHSERVGRLKVPDDEEEEETREPLPGMPCCPITGFPMMHPVVAADGHTYERSAIAIWLQTSDKSPLTGGILAHKELVPNYMLLSSLQELIDVKPEVSDST
jgi:hypothetical protein